jgi:hypothetical protein
VSSEADEAQTRELLEREARIAIVRARPKDRMCVLCGDPLSAALLKEAPDSLDCGGACGKGA